MSNLVQTVLIQTHMPEHSDGLTVRFRSNTVWSMHLDLCASLPASTYTNTNTLTYSCPYCTLWVELYHANRTKTSVISLLTFTKRIDHSTLSNGTNHQWNNQSYLRHITLTHSLPRFSNLSPMAQRYQSRRELPRSTHPPSFPTAMNMCRHSSWILQRIMYILQRLRAALKLNLPRYLKHT